MEKASNFFAGPSVLPAEVLEEMSRELVNYKGSGVSMIENSHRSASYDEIHNRAIDLFREIFDVPSNYHVLFLQGGGTLQFGMIPLNLLKGNKKCDYVISGAWSKKAYDDAVKLGDVNVVFDGKDSGYTTLPDPSSIKVSPDSSYLYITSNETIGGIQWKDWPETGDVPLVCDMSSDILSRSVDVNKFGMIYGGAQKNLGPAGVTIVIIRDDLLARSPEDLPAYLNYNTHADKNSLYNTPPVFAIWAIQLVLERMKRLGGLKTVMEVNRKKAALIYDAIDSSGGFYKSAVDNKYRSLMNIVFTLQNSELESKFLSEASTLRMIGLKGHKSVGGCRASTYNALPIEDAEKLAHFMNDFCSINKS